MSEKAIGVGVIGCGTISDTYLPNLTECCKNIKVLACADMFPEKAADAAKKYGIPTACTVDGLLAMNDIQLVVNLTIPKAHHEINMKALAAGKNVYCEKPLALSLAEANAQYELAKNRGLIVASAPDTFLGAGIQTARAVLDSGRIGEAVSFTANLMSHGVELWHPNAAFYYKEGAGPMLDMGPYYMTALVSLLGPVKRISCFARKSAPQREIKGVMEDVEVNTSYCGIVEFECGVIGNVNMSFDVWASALPCMEIFCTGGVLTAPDPNMFQGPVKVLDGGEIKRSVEAVQGSYIDKLIAMISWKITSSKEETLIYPCVEGERSNMRGMGVQEIAQAMLDGRRPRLCAELSRHVAEALVAFDTSAAEGKPYEMTTTCERPEAMPAGLGLWEPAKQK